MRYIKKIKNLAKKILTNLRSKRKNIPRKKSLKSEKIKFAPRREIEKAKISSQSEISSAKFDTEIRHMPQTVTVGETLPVGYGDDIIIIQVRDPWWIHSYWELRQDTIERVKRNLGTDFEVAKWALRVFDVSYIDFKGGNANSFFDIEVDYSARNWYICVLSGRSYIVDLGLKLPNGNFITIVRSNCVTTPLDGPSWIIDEAWLIPDEEFSQIYTVGFGSSPRLVKKKGKIGEFIISSPGFVSSFIGKRKSA